VNGDKVRVATAAVVAIAALASGVRADKPPPLLWSVSDDTLTAPLGAITDVAVGSDGTVFLLDSQNFMVRRISSEGKELPSLGRRGEGPGEFMHPRLVAALQGGACVVLQDFYAPAVCFEGEEDRLCVAPDLAIIRSGFLATILMDTARIDAHGRLLVSLFAIDRASQKKAVTGRSAGVNAVFRLEPGSPSPVVLFSNGPSVASASTVQIPGQAGSFAARCWDVDTEGTIIYADPSNRYRVIIGHPVDGESRLIELPVQPMDEAKMRRLEEEYGWESGWYPRVSNVYWLDEGRFLVVPGAEATEPVPSVLGVWEAFDDRGRSLGRHPLRCDFDAGQDSYYVRNGTLVVIKGGKSANEAVHAQMAAMLGIKAESSGDSAPASDVIRIDAYDLNSHYAAMSNSPR